MLSHTQTCREGLWDREIMQCTGKPGKMKTVETHHTTEKHVKLTRKHTTLMSTTKTNQPVGKEEKLTAPWPAERKAQVQRHAATENSGAHLFSKATADLEALWHWYSNARSICVVYENMPQERKHTRQLKERKNHVRFLYLSSYCLRLSTVKELGEVQPARAYLSVDIPQILI